VPARLTRVVESPSLFSSQRVRGVYDFFGREPGAPIEEEPSSATRPRRGARVRHPSLGQGVVLDLEGDGDDLKITVYFDRAGKRKLIARYASLEPI
jgi:DNA helicase-2/ATP-dependent DNA helicase PcrA